MTGIAMEDSRIINAMTVDVEDYFQVSAFEQCIPRADWPRWPQRVEGNTRRILEIFDRQGVKGTFFVLGWVAERFPALVRRIAESGHEVASHGFGHERLINLTREQFREGIRRTKGLLEDITGRAVSGYRAPSYSVGPGTLWAHAELREAGYRYSSSIVPIHHDLYGMPAAPRFAFYAGDTGLLEVPVTTLALFGRNWPCGGGGYFRLLPFALFKWGLQHVNQHEQRPGVFYFHPWEIDPEQPRVPGVSFKNRVRHYLNLSRMADKLGLLLRDFRFDRMDKIFLTRTAERYPTVMLQDPQFCAK
ncbi:MAG: XrtA system polysaccharide deacetylase [Gammaproteobacteria bacterium]